MKYSRHTLVAASAAILFVAAALAVPALPSLAQGDGPPSVFLPATGRDVGAPGTRPDTATPTPTDEATPTDTPIPTATETPTVTPTPTHTPEPPPPAETVLIPAGTFQMGCDASRDTCPDNETPLHTVNLDAYQIDKHEVSNAHYEQCVLAGVCTAPRTVNSYTRSPYFGNPAYGDYPVIEVSWHQATSYCEWLGKRLPSEAEWERAARGDDDTRIYPWGDAAPTCAIANYELSCVGDTAAAGSYASGASPFGVMDMSGNVSEWVNDWYDEAYYSVSPADNPLGPAGGELRVLRGGGWHFGEDYVRVTNRFRDLPENTGPNPATGFRCAWTP